MKTFFAFFLSLLPAFAADHIISWSPNPTNENVLGYSIYEQMGSPPAWVKRLDLGMVTTATLSGVTPGWHIYSLTASNSVYVSAMSVPVSAYVPFFPSAPTNVIIQLRASVETGPSSN